MNEAKTETIKNGCRLAVGPMRRVKEVEKIYSPRMEDE